ncbi:MAG: cbb3-type cytochrome c oxidase subunit 3 [Gammaproteobacteria bacterium]|uniref:cbb3-type cytochrome oxidase subunit 3 n=1 Tax=Pseudomaricurvus alcaniphilus TaxID=1166482 RepID=UPI0014098470|nr:cbb3-type cytochrome c oxidase subunit 3 [Pseudomaricurvus alcaniphilus]MBR9908914.1 cbb3-type cytochrome c oxidase subunit 3 [Gammaproteobacteria bacterium]NHN37967.1 cbb3-type cytochrome c oxidase subunit 3 [Pseudomaricurvus alcaniphilus]
MDLNTLKGFSTILVMIAFAGVCWWAFSPSRRKQFKEAAELPFADDVPAPNKTLRPAADEDKAE